MSVKVTNPPVKLSAINSNYRLRRELPLYLFWIPGVLFFIIYRYLPMYGIIMAFQDFRLARGFASRFIGVANFEKLFTSAIFPTVIQIRLPIAEIL